MQFISVIFFVNNKPFLYVIGLFTSLCEYNMIYIANSMDSGLYLALPSQPQGGNTIQQHHLTQYFLINYYFFESVLRSKSAQNVPIKKPLHSLHVAS